MSYSELMNHAKLTVLANNARFQTDTQAEVARRRETLRRSMSRGYDPSVVKYLPIIEQIFSDIATITLFDIHDGAVGVNELKYRLTLEYARRLSNAYIILGGDTFNNVTLTSIGATPNADKYGIMDAVDKQAYQLISVVHKLVTMIDGNHDGKKAGRNANCPNSFVKNLADKLEVHYTPYGVLIEWFLPSKDANRKPESIKVFAFHSSDKCPGFSSAPEITFEKALADLENSGIIPDIIFGGHFHANTNGIFKFKTFEVDSETHIKKAVYIDIPVISESSLQEVAEYAVAHDAAPTDSNVYVNVLAKKNGRLLKERIPIFIKNDVLEDATYKLYMRNPLYYDEHPNALFEKGKGLISPRAMEYLQAHQEPLKETQKEVENIKNMDDKSKTSRVEDILNNANSQDDEEMTMNKEGR